MIGLRGVVASAFCHIAVAGWLMTSAVRTPKPEEDMSAAEMMMSVSLDAAEPAQQAEDAPPPAVEQKVEAQPIDPVPDAVASLPESQPPVPEIVQPELAPEPAPVVRHEPPPEPQNVASLDSALVREVERPQQANVVEKIKPRLVEKKVPAPSRKDAGDGKGSSQPKPASAGWSGSKAAGSGGSAQSRAYPSMVLARLRGTRPSGGAVSGRVTLSFTVSSSGGLISAGAFGGDAGAKSAALGMLHRAAPFPPIPASANKSRWTFTVPVQFD